MSLAKFPYRAAMNNVLSEKGFLQNIKRRLLGPLLDDRLQRPFKFAQNFEEETPQECFGIVLVGRSIMVILSWLWKSSLDIEPVLTNPVD